MSRLSAIALLIGCLTMTGCGAMRSFQSAYHTSFRTSFKKNFLASCRVAAKGKPHAEAYCRCAEARVEKKYSDQELVQISTAQTADQKEFMRTVVRSCALESAAQD